MKYTEIIQNIESNQKAIAAFGKFDREVLNKINYKLRLDWNYYSNRMEGGTLTLEETRSVMVGNIEVQGKPLKDVFEMNGHDKVVLEILKMGANELSLSERRIKEIHKAIMHEENPENHKLIGNWKIYANEIINYRGEKISFAAPNEVAEKVHKLLDSTNAKLSKFSDQKGIQSAIELAAQFHIDFVTIHPFYDGNGRISRILTNILLVAAGLPVIVIKDEHKRRYYQYLADIQVYGGKADLFYAFIGERIIDSQQLILSALKGETIEDEDDNAKRLSLIEKQLSVIAEEDEVKIQFGAELINHHFDMWISSFINSLLIELFKLNHLFISPNHKLLNLSFIASQEFSNLEKEHSLHYFKTQLNKLISEVDYNKEIIRLNSNFGTFKKSGSKPFELEIEIRIEFTRNNFNINWPKINSYGVLVYEPVLVDKLNSTVSLKQQKAIVNQYIKTILDYIEFQMKSNGIV